MKLSNLIESVKKAKEMLGFGFSMTADEVLKMLESIELDEQPNVNVDANDLALHINSEINGGDVSELVSDCSFEIRDGERVAIESLYLEDIQLVRRLKESIEGYFESILKDDE